jgi:TolA-binding protein
MKGELKGVIHAYRELHGADALNTQAIEQRIVTSVSRRRVVGYSRASGRRFSSVTAAAATFIGATAAYALTDHGRERLRDLVAWLAPDYRQEGVGAPGAAAVSGVAAVPSAEATSASQSMPPSESEGDAESANLPVPLPRDPAATDVAADVATGERDRAVVSRSQGGARSSNAPVFTPPSGEHSPKTSGVREPKLMAGDETHRQLYRRAQRLAVEGRHQEALALWDEYLARYATAPLHVEARFNRIRLLIALGRYQEASAALVPFANGEFGSYRQEQARSMRRRLVR